ncbi:MAG: hypothetical protein JJV88_00870 [Sulfurovum sp.]|nr:hypothetical protein [Sulfurovaceae bacterium]
MSINLDSMASDFNCSIDDVKSLLTGVVSQVNSFVEIIEVSITSSDFEAVKIASEMILQEVKSFHVSDITSAVSSLISASNSEDIDGVNNSFNSLKSAISDLNNSIS